MLLAVANYFEIGDCGGASQIELVLAAAEVTGVSALPSARVCLAMFNRHALAEFLSTCRGGGLLPKPMLKKLVVSDRYRSSAVGCSIGALRSQFADATGLGRELDLGAQNDGLLCTGWKGNRAVAHVDLEARLP